MSKKCPDCTSQNTKCLGIDVKRPVSTVFLVFGLFFPLFYALSRRRTFLCHDCNHAFHSQTTGSIFFCLIYWCYLAIIVAALVLGFLFLLRFFLQNL